MGFSETNIDSDSAKKWVIAGIPLRAPLKPIYTAAKTGVDQHRGQSTERENEEDCSSNNNSNSNNDTTPKGEESRIPEMQTCPPAPRKRKASRKCNYGAAREFFNPPDLETVFTIRHIARG